MPNAAKDDALSAPRQPNNLRPDLLTGAGMPFSQAAGPAATNQCSTGGSNPNTPGADTGTQAGTPGAENVIQNQGGAGRSAPLASDLTQTINNGTKGTDVKFVSTSGGNPTPGYIGSFRHDYGKATDGHFTYQGRVLNANNSEDRAILSNTMCDLSKSGVRGFGWGNDYMGGSTFHLDQHGVSGSNGSQSLVWGAGGRSANAAPWLKDTVRECAPPGAPLANSGSPTPEEEHAPGACEPPPNNGCQPISAGTVGVASSLMQGLGMGPAAALTGALALLQNGPMGLLQGAVQTALAGAIPMAGALTQGGLTNPLTQVTEAVKSQIGNLGNSIIPSLTGVMPSTSLIGNTNLPQ